MIKYFAKTFTVTTGLFFCAMLFSDMAIMPVQEAFEGALGSGLVYGAVLTLVMGTLHVVRVRRAAGAGTEGDIYAVRQSRRFEIPLDREKVFAAAEHYLGATRRFSLPEKSAEAGLLKAVTPFNFSNSGSVITVKLAANPAGGTSVEVTARPFFFLILADYGDNFRLARAVQEHLQALS